MDTINVDGFVTRLREFDALRIDDNIMTGAIERIRPQLAENGQRNWIHLSERH